MLVRAQSNLQLQHQLLQTRACPAIQASRLCQNGSASLFPECPVRQCHPPSDHPAHAAFPTGRTASTIGNLPYSTMRGVMHCALCHSQCTMQGHVRTSPLYFGLAAPPGADDPSLPSMLGSPRQKPADLQMPLQKSTSKYRLFMTQHLLAPYLPSIQRVAQLELAWLRLHGADLPINAVDRARPAAPTAPFLVYSM